MPSQTHQEKSYWNSIIHSFHLLFRGGYTLEKLISALLLSLLILVGFLMAQRFSLSYALISPAQQAQTEHLRTITNHEYKSNLKQRLLY